MFNKEPQPPFPFAEGLLGVAALGQFPGQVIAQPAAVLMEFLQVVDLGGQLMATLRERLGGSAL